MLNYNNNSFFPWLQMYVSFYLLSCIGFFFYFYSFILHLYILFVVISFDFYIHSPIVLSTPNLSETATKQNNPSKRSALSHCERYGTVKTPPLLKVRKIQAKVSFLQLFDQRQRWRLCLSEIFPNEAKTMIYNQYMCTNIFPLLWIIYAPFVHYRVL